MNYKKIIPCLDIKNGRVVKGVNFADLRDAGDIAENARFYCGAGADELVFLDITATNEGRKTFADLITEASKYITVPLTVGGGISCIEDIEILLSAGADKVGISSAAVKDKYLIERAANKFGSKRIVSAIDAKCHGDSFRVYINGGLTETDIDAIEWAREVERLGAGEILLTSMDRDGTKIGFDIELTAAVASAVKIPVIASGGGGTREHFLEAFKCGAESALAATLFHFREIEIADLKAYLKSNGISVR